ncbi:phosphatidylinositol kinase- protein kinase tor1 [Coemansia sp. RSA 485]|nr:phosphatidylinositol kinase- protein kinase tor1 [Coemansia sp. RSA 485]
MSDHLGEHVKPDLLRELRSEDSGTRANASATLRNLISDAEAGGKRGEENPVYAELNSRLRRLVSAPNIQDRLACAAILSALVDIDMLETKQKMRVMGQLGSLLKTSDMVVCTEAAMVFKKVLRKRWPEAINSAEKEVNLCLEWLGNERSEVRRMTALLLLEALCQESTATLYQYATKILTSLSPPLRDNKLEMRLAAARALGACLQLVPKQDQSPRNVLLNYLFEELQRDQQLGTAEGYHASLLRCQELVQYGGMFMQAHLGQASEMALKLKDHRDPVVRKAAICLLPMLARYSPQDFTKYTVGGESLLVRSCSFLIALARASERDRPTSFLALAHISQCCNIEFRPFLEPTTRAIRDVLAMRAKSRNATSETDETATAILRTIAILATAMGPALTRYMRDILDLMFTTGLSEALCDSLTVVEREVSQLQPAIQDRLLDMVSIILVGVPFRPVQPSLDGLENRMGSASLHYANASSTYASSTTSNGTSNYSLANDRTNGINGTTAMNGSGAGSGAANGVGLSTESTSLVVAAASSIPVTNEIIVLALRTLSNFDFSQENLSEFVRNDVLQYLNHSSAAVRKQAIHAVSHIVLSDPLYRTMAGAGVEVASEVVQRLVASAVTDLDAEVRLMAVRMLEKGSCFDFHMGKAQNIQSLFLLLNDEVFEVRMTVLAVIGRLANMNPAHVMPSLRRMVVQLLTELEFARSNREREQCIQLLMVLVRAAENWVRPYVGDIFRTILPRIDEGSPQLASKLLDTIAELARVGGSDLVPYADRLLASIMQALCDSASAQKRMAALKALGSCATFCSMAIEPYTDYPQLFAILSRLLKTESDEMKEETMRVIGALGAIDPHRYKDAMGQASAKGSAAGITNGAAGTSAVLAGAAGDNNTIVGVAGINGAIDGPVAGAIRPGSLTSKKYGRNAGKRGGKRHGGPPPNVMTVFNNEKPRENLVGDIQVDSYGTTFSSEPNYFTSVSVNALLRILNSPADAKSHLLAVQALNTMFAPLQNVCGQYLDSVVPAILRAMKAAPPEAAESYIERLGRLVGIARQLIRPYLEPLFELFDSEAVISEQQQNVLIGLIEVLAEALAGDFGPHIATVIPFLIAVIDRDVSQSHQPTLNALHALRILSPSLEGYLFLIMPRLILLLDFSTTAMGVVSKALESIGSIVASVNCSSFASRIVLTLVRLLQSAPTQALQTGIIDTLCILMEQLQDEFTLFMPTINAAMKKRGVGDHAKYERYSRLLFSGRLIPKETQRVQPLLQGESTQPDVPLGQNAGGGPKLYVDANQLRNAWSTQQRVANNDWMGWLDNFAVELLRQSPSPALRATCALASNHPKLRSELFNAAFVSCWTELPGQYQQEVISSLQEVASKPDVSSDILQTILSLAGFMERDEKQIPIDLKLLGEYADRCHALAKELHYKEAEWTLEKGYGTIEKLIELNQSLDLHDSAIGMLNYVRKEQPDIEESVEWYIRLQRWDEALTIFRQEEVELGYNHANMTGQIRCLFEMSDWETLVPLYDRIWQSNDQQMIMASASFGMSMAWAMGDIERMEVYLSVLPNRSQDKSFCKGLLAVYRNQFEEAASYIHDARMEMKDDLVSHVTESYSRGYSQIFRCQLLTELEEVMAYKTAHDDKERQVAITSTWRKRLDGIQEDVGMWQKLLRVRSMVLRPILDLDTWIKYVNMCRKSDNMKIARHAIHQLLEDETKYMEEINRGEFDVPQKLAIQAQEYARLKSQLHQSRRGPIAGSHWDSRERRFSTSSANGQAPVSFDHSSLDAAIQISQQPALAYMYLKFKWANEERREAFQMLEMFANNYSSKIGFDPRNPNLFADQIDAHMLANASGSQADVADDTRMYRLLARFYFKRAEWLSTIQQTATLAQEARQKSGLGGGSNLGGPGDISLYSMNQQALIQQQQQQQQRMSSRRESIGVRRPRKSISSYNASANGAANLPANGGDDENCDEDHDESQTAKDADFIFRLKGDRINESILESYRAATVLDSKWYKAWHLLALRHYHETQRYDMEHATVPEDIIEKHVVPAVHGFFRAIQLSKSDTTLQDTLRLLTAWFNYSEHESVAQAVLDGFNSVSLRTWLQVIPQILARIHIQFESTSRLIKQLLVEVGKFHPNAILFSLYVAARGDHPERSQAAKAVLAKLHDLVPELVEETEVVSRELIRITLLFPEMWHDALDTASKYYFRQNDPVEMMRILQPLHDRARNPETLREYHFVQMFGNELATAEQHVKHYFSADLAHRNEAVMHQAWEVYYNIFRRIQKLFPDPKALTLKDTAPVLLQCRNMHLAVPGTYDPDRDIVRIDSFDPVVRVYGTKQHPREMHIHGSDGNKYTFILKGHEDLRQDERVMQLFGLINSLLARDNETARRSLAIERYPVTPLSSNSGLIGFYPNCENIHEIIQNYRDAHHQILNLEQRLAQQFSPNWDTLTILQKVESFEYALSNTPGNDLQRAMWYKSPNAETWLERRTNYTRSLAVMSIAGYILGLGDRHPSNIMMHIWTGKVVHIDFGDCFELAAHREKFPETVPFRLTRMFIMPMEVSTIEGSFKFTANHTMRVLRANRDSLMAVLEAFVFDPLVSWSFIQENDETANNTKNNGKQQEQQQQRGPKGQTSRNNNQTGFNGADIHMSRWDAATNVSVDVSAVLAGSRPDERGGKSIKFKNEGFEDKGWQTGNPKARAIVKRIHDKLMGTDFDPNTQLTVAEQIEKLIQQATSSENLAVLYVGWVPLW